MDICITTYEYMNNNIETELGKRGFFSKFFSTSTKRKMYWFQIEGTKSRIFVGISKEPIGRIIKDSMTNKLNRGTNRIMKQAWYNK